MGTRHPNTLACEETGKVSPSYRAKQPPKRPQRQTAQPATIAGPKLEKLRKKGTLSRGETLAMAGGLISLKVWAPRPDGRVPT
jgi:hypothetical protein